MLYNDRFAGHFDSDDPRTPVTAAGACTWPTVPPFRVEFASTNATGPWSCFNYDTALLEMDLVTTTHGHAWWLPVRLPPCVYSMSLEKIAILSLFPRWTYWLTITLVGWPNEQIFPHNSSAKCNKDIIWGDLARYASPYGSGSTFTQFQTEWDQNHHPNWVPPP